MTSHTFVTGRTATVAEVHLVARRLAMRLDCTHALVAAPEHLEGIGALADSIDVRLLAAAGDVKDLRECSQSPVSAVGDHDGLADLPMERTLFLLSPSTLEVMADESVRNAASEAAAVVVGAGRHWAPGPRGVTSLRKLAAGKGLRTVHVGLLRAAGHPGSRRESPFLVAAGPATERRVAELLKAGEHGLALDPEIDLRAAAPRQPRVCIASYEVVGPTKNGGIGTANTSLAQALARAGHEVTLLFTGPEEPDVKIDVDRWRQHYMAQGISFEVLRSSGRPGSPHPNVRRSYELYEWLLRRDRNEPFDVVHFPDCQGHGYFPVLAKRYGLAFDNTLLVVGVHSATRWVHEANREPMRWVEPLVTEHLERESVGFADVLISPSAYLIDYLTERGWRIPRRWFVQQYVLPRSVVTHNGSRAGRRRPSEVVFFGRLEMRKGLEAFCDALDLLAKNNPDPDLSITFMGKAEHLLSQPAEDYVAYRGERWPWRWRILSDLAHSDGIAYLRSRPCIAVVPSLVDNSPNTVMEALALELPLVASRTGGTGELIHIADLERCSFDGWTGVDKIQPGDHFDSVAQFDSAALADRMRAVLAEPSRPARFAVAPPTNEEMHVRWHTGVAAASGGAAGGSISTDHGIELQSISLCVVHREDGLGLRETLSDIELQESQPTDLMVVVSDPPSSAGTATVRVGELCGEGWTLSDGERVRAGADLNTALDQLAGQVLVFLRSGDRAQPDFVRRVREFAGRTSADVLAFPVWNAAPNPVGGPAFPVVASEDSVAVDPTTAVPGLGVPEPLPDTLPAVREPSPSLLLPISGPALLGLVYPAFSVGSFAIRRQAFSRLGGFAPDARGDEGEHDLLNRALLEGLRIEVVPAPLATRVTEDRWAEVRTAQWAPVVPWTYDSDQQVRLARAYAALLPTQLRDLPSLLRGLQDGDAGQQVTIFEQAKHLRLQHERLEELEAWILHLETQLRAHDPVDRPAIRLRRWLGRQRERARRLTHSP